MISQILKKEPDKPNRRKHLQIFKYTKRWVNKKGSLIKKEGLSGPFGMMIKYQNYVKSGYIAIISMHTQGLKNFVCILERCFLPKSIR